MGGAFLQNSLATFTILVLLGTLGCTATTLRAEAFIANCSDPHVGQLVTVHDMSDVGVKRVHLTCPEVYTTEGESVITCTYNNETQESEWTPDPLRFTCDYPCTVPNLPEGLSVSPNDPLIWSGEDVSFTCTEGMLPEDAPRTSRCQNGSWSQPIPSCNLKHGSIRLKNGRVMVTYGENEGSICFTEEWDIHNANVVCRQLGLSPYALSVTRKPFGQTNDLIHFDSVRCQGYEEKLIDCGLSFSPCNTRYYAGVVCLEGDESASEGSVRLIEVGDAEIPRVEMYLNGIWGAVCAGVCNHETSSCKDGWSIERAGWFCQELGYPEASGVGVHRKYDQEKEPIIFLECPADAGSLGDCTHYYLGRDVPCEFGALHVSCEKADKFSLRLINGSTKDEGRLEIFDGGHWRTVPLFRDSVTPERICERLTGSGNYIQGVDGAFGNGLVMPKYTYSCPEDAGSLSKCDNVKVSDDDMDDAPISLYCNQESTEMEVGTMNPQLICLTAFSCTLVIVVIAVVIRLYYHKKRLMYHRMGSHVSDRYDNPKGEDCDEENKTEMGEMKSDRTDSASDDAVFND